MITILQCIKKETLKCSLLVIGFMSAGGLYAQELYVASGGNLSVSAGDALYVNNNLGIHASGSLTVNSSSSTSGSLLVTGTSTGNIVYERNIADSNWHLVAAPVSSQSINSFATGNNAINTNGSNYAIATYNNSNSAGSRWEYYTTTSAPSAGNFTPAKGYSTNRTAAGTFTFEGEMATSNVPISLSTTSGTHHWACIGNPYPSFLKGTDDSEINSVLKENFSVLDDSYKALYLWDGSVYQAINYASGVTYLAPGQSFMVKARSANESFNFSESDQSHQSGVATFYRVLSTPTIDLFVNNGAAEKTTRLKYYDTSTLGLDPGYDAAAFEDGVPDFSLNTHLVANSEGLNFTLQCLPNNSYETTIIPISVNAEAGTTLSFSSLQSGDLPEDLHIYLNDIVNNQITDLKVENYEITLPATLQGIGQFYLQATAQELTITTQEPTDLSIYFVTNNTLFIKGIQGDKEASIKLYNTLGQLVFTQNFNAAPTIHLALPNIPTGIYIAELQTQLGTHSQKIISK